MAVEKSDEAYGLQMQKVCSKIGTYATALGVTPAEITALNNDKDLFVWSFEVQSVVQDYAQNITAFKNLVRHGNGTEVITAAPVPPTFPATPAIIVAANVQDRFSKLVQRIKGSTNYTKSIGEDLGIEVAHTPFDPQLGKPVFKTTYSSGGHPHLIWKKGKFQGVEIWVDRNDGKGWVKLERDFHPDYTDKSPLPATGQTAVWRYKMIYLYQDETVGEWSDDATMTVYGSV